MHVPPAALPAPERMALFLDVDGTLIDFAERPEAVRVPADLAGALAAARDRVGAALALLSGRTIAELDAIATPLRLPASGVHGAELREADGGPVRRVAPVLPQPTRSALAAAVADVAGILVEDKAVSLAVHFRAVPAARELLAARLAAAVPPGFLLTEGDQVFELRPAAFDKGRALRGFMARPPFAGRVPVFVSDHPIDAAGFRAAAELGGLGISVGARLPEAAHALPHPGAVRAWLRELAA